MPKTHLFVGSSSAAKSQAKALIKEFAGPTLAFLPWWDAFTPGRSLLEELDAVRSKVQGALLLFSPESTTTIRKKKHNVPNLNVLFEFGYFYGHFGKARVAMVKYGDGTPMLHSANSSSCGRSQPAAMLSIGRCLGINHHRNRWANHSVSRKLLGAKHW